MQTFGEKIRAARMEIKITQVQLAQMIGEKSGTVINNWETSTSRPSVDKIPKICQALHISPDLLFDVTGDNPSIEEMALIHKYRDLDSFGKNAVDSVINIEYDRIISTTRKKPKVRRIQLDSYTISASAGVGNFLDNEAPDKIWVKDTPEAEKADFVIPISGDSMEPSFHDGDKVFVEKRADVEKGDIAIFVVNGDVFIKELGNKCLISHNKAYKPIPLLSSDSIYCCGRVLGVVEE